MSHLCRLSVVAPLAGLTAACFSLSHGGEWPSLAARPGEDAARCIAGEPVPRTEPGAPAAEVESPQVPTFDNQALAAQFDRIRTEWEEVAGAYRSAADGTLQRQVLLGRLESSFLAFAALESELAAYRREFSGPAAFQEGAPEAAALWARFQAFRQRHVELVGGTSIAANVPPRPGCVVG